MIDMEENVMARIIFAITAILCFLTIPARADWDTTRPSMKVAVVPFAFQGDTGQQWIGNAIQDGLATGLHQVSGIIVAGLAPNDAAGAINLTKYTGADAVVFGSVQIVDKQIRVTGQIISIETGESLGSLRSDGSLRDLFDIEDVLAARIERILIPPPANHAASSAPAQFQLVGPTISPGPSRYFDGNLMAQLTPKLEHRDDYNKYYYYSADTSSCYGSYGPPCGAFSYGFFPACGVSCAVPAYPVHGW
jgi:TolB-like protein